MLIPLTYNDGSRVSREILDSIFESLFVLSGGYTAAGTVRGAYRMRDGSKQTDVLEQVWIADEEGDQPALRELVGRSCSLLGQEAMSLEFADSAIEFIPPHEEA